MIRRHLPRRSRWSASSLPLSTIINFAALFILFGAVVMLQRQESSRQTAVVETLQQIAPSGTTLVQTAPLTDLKKAATAAATAPVVKVAPQDVHPARKASVVQASADKPRTPTPEAPAVDIKRTQDAKRRATASVRSASDRHAADRAVSVDDLDTESARQAYMAQNRRLSGPALEDNVAPTRWRVVEPVRSPHTGADASAELDSSNARAHYLAENERLAGDSNSASMATGMALAGPQPLSQQAPSTH